MRAPVEVLDCFLGGLAHDRQLQVATDHARDLPERRALFGHAVIAGSGGSSLKRELKEVGSIDTVHGGRAVQPVAHVCRETLLSRDTDEYRNEAVIAIAMD